MAKRLTRVRTRYRVLTGIYNDALGIGYNAGDVADLGDDWDVAGLLAVGAIVSEDSYDIVGDLPFAEVDDGNG